MRLPFRVESVTIHRGHVFPKIFPCDCRGIACEDFLDTIAEHVLAAGLLHAPSLNIVELPSGDWLGIVRGR